MSKHENTQVHISLYIFIYICFWTFCRPQIESATVDIQTFWVFPVDDWWRDHFRVVTRLSSLRWIPVHPTGKQGTSMNLLQLHWNERGRAASVALEHFSRVAAQLFQMHYSPLILPQHVKMIWAGIWQIFSVLTITTSGRLSLNPRS